MSKVDGWLLIMAAFILLGFCICTWIEYDKCEDRGGTMVQGLMWFECVE